MAACVSGAGSDRAIVEGHLAAIESGSEPETRLGYWRAQLAAMDHADASGGIIEQEHRRIAQSLSQQGYGRIYAIVPAGDPCAHYVATEGSRGIVPVFYVQRVYVGELTLAYGECAAFEDRCSASAYLRDLAGMPSWWTPGPLAGVHGGKMAVRVELLNDDGVKRFAIGYGDTADEAVAQSEIDTRRRSGDRSYCMSEWRGA